MKRKQIDSIYWADYITLPFDHTYDLDLGGGARGVYTRCLAHPRPAQPSAPTPTAPRTTPPNAPSAAPSTLPLGYPHNPTNRPLRGSQHPPPRHPTDSRPVPPPQPPAPRPHGTTRHTLHRAQRSPQPPFPRYQAYNTRTCHARYQQTYQTVPHIPICVWHSNPSPLLWFKKSSHVSEFLSLWCVTLYQCCGKQPTHISRPG